jgi:inner membrane protein
MDPICHTLVGGTLAQTGLKRRTALGMTTLLIAANLPDIDILAYIDGPTTALWFRRGWTHGVLAWLVLPLLLTGTMLFVDRLWRRPRGGEPARPGAVLALSAVGVASHPLLDLLNVYGVRLLMPFSDRWFYGDTLFIVDPWVWAMLAAGIMISRRREREGSAGAAGRPALVAVGVLAFYVLAMAGVSTLTRRQVEETMSQESMGAPERLMTAPVPVNPLRRRVVAEVDKEYAVATLAWPFGRAEVQRVGLSREPDFRSVAARRGPVARRFLSWARFPYFVVDEIDDESVVIIGDARYTLAPYGSWASVLIPLAPAPSQGSE